jgi:hypothetical protein
MIAVLAAVLALAAPAHPCTGGALHGSFKVVPGSAGAGNIVYRLRLTNTGSSACWVSGLPVGRLLGAARHALPTHVRAAQVGQGAAAKIVLAHGRAAIADARFSPDVPGPGEGTIGRCEPVAHFLRFIAPGGGAVALPVRPPTSVCEHGTLSFKVFRAAP